MRSRSTTVHKIRCNGEVEVTCCGWRRLRRSSGIFMGAALRSRLELAMSHLFGDVMLSVCSIASLLTGLSYSTVLVRT